MKYIRIRNIGKQGMTPVKISRRAIEKASTLYSLFVGNLL